MATGPSLAQRGVHHVLELSLARRRHDDEVGDQPQVGEVERAVVRGAVVADKSRPVEREDHGDVLQRDVLHEHVEGPLQEGRVDRHDGLHAGQRQARGKDDGVLLGDAHVVEAAGKLDLETFEAGALRHGGGDRHHPGIAPRLAHDDPAERLGVGRSAGTRPALAVAALERSRPVVFGRLLLGRLVALALDRAHVDQDGTPRVHGLAHRFAQRADVVAVHHADVGEAELLEDEARAEEGLHALLDVLAQTVGAGADGRDAGDGALHVLAQAGEARVEAEPVEVELEGADVGLDRHLVVVQHDDERRAELPGLVHRLEGDPAREGPVAHHAHDPTLGVAAQPRALDQAQPVADRGRGVPRADDVVLGLAAAGEPGEASVLADGVEALGPSGDDLVGVGLVADVPDDLVAGAFEDAVQGDRELDRAEAGGQMAADLADARQDHLAYLVGEVLELGDGQ